MLDLREQNIASIIWSTGYRFAFDWLKIPVLSKDGVPIQERGVTRRAGLYFLGLHWMHTFKSGVIFGVGDDASHIADHMTVHADGRVQAFKEDRPLPSSVSCVRE
jgi:putative flavoprotein involved in K+ transport